MATITNTAFGAGKGNDPVSFTIAQIAARFHINITTAPDLDGTGGKFGDNNFYIQERDGADISAKDLAIYLLLIGNWGKGVITVVKKAVADAESKNPLIMKPAGVNLQSNV